MSSTSTYIITGSNRGLGLGYVKILIRRSNAVVYAGVRSVESAGELTDLAKSHQNLHVVQLVSGSASDVQNLVSQLGEVEGPVVVISNAGISNHYATVENANVDAVQEHFRINTLGPLILFQGVAPILKKAKGLKFIAITSILGSIAHVKESPPATLAYGVSKAGLNYMVAEIAKENPELVALAIHPGWVQTEMGNDCATAFGFPQAPLTLEESVKGVIEVTDKATLADSGTFVDNDGKVWPW